MTIPPYLKHGDKIGILSTARAISKEEIQTAVDFLTSKGYGVELAENLFEKHHQFAGTDNQRASDFNSMIHNPEIKAILCARGGYGTVRILDKIDFDAFSKSPKWIVGYSDVTALHGHLQRVLGIASIHATMPVNFPTNTAESLQTLLNSLTGDANTYNFPAHPLNRKGEMKGPVVGGNLSMVYSLLGSESAVETNGKILFLEDLDEYLYHIDRMMMNLKRNGLFENLNGVIIGGMTDMNDNTIPFGKTAIEIISEHLSEYDFPFCFNFPAGHLKDNRAIKMGMEATVSVNDETCFFTQ